MLALRQESTSDVQATHNDVTILVETALKTLSGQGFVQFHPHFARKLGSYKAAIFLGHALYWTRFLARKNPQRKGWFYLTAAQCEKATGLSTREQVSARKLLVQNQLLVELLAGRPARLHYKLNMAMLAQWLGLAEPEPSWSSLAPLFESGVSFYRPLAQLAGSVAGGLYLSLLLQEQRTALRRGCAKSQSGIALSQACFRTAIGLSDKTHRNTRTKLKQAGFVEDESGQIRLQLGPLMRELQSLGLAAQDAAPALPRLTSPPQAQDPVATAPGTVQATVKPLLGADSTFKQQVQLPLNQTLEDQKDQDNKMGVLRLMDEGSTAKQGLVCEKGRADATKPALLSKLGGKPALLSKLNRPFVEPYLPFCRNYIQVGNNITTTTSRMRAREGIDSAVLDEKFRRRRRFSDENTSRQQGALSEPELVLPEQASGDTTPEPASADAGLILPRDLQPDCHEAVLRVVSRAEPSIRQALLDELAGQLQIDGKTIHNPAGWLHALVRQSRAGRLDLAMAERVAADRRVREKAEQAYAQALAATPHVPASTQAPQDESPPPSTEALKARQKLREMRAQMAGARGGYEKQK